MNELDAFRFDTGGALPYSDVIPEVVVGDEDPNACNMAAEETSEEGGYCEIVAPDTTTEDTGMPEYARTPASVTPGNEDDRPTAAVQVHERSLTEDMPGEAVLPPEHDNHRLRVDERSHLFTDAPPIHQADILRRKYEWQQNIPVTSTVTAAGFIEPTPEEAHEIRHPLLTAANYGSVQMGGRLWRPAADLHDSLGKVVRADIERNGLEGNLLFEAKVGNFAQQRHSEPFHSDNAPGAYVRWTVAVGIGSTIGANGMISRAETTLAGDIKETVKVGAGEQLEPVRFREGEVVRFMGSGDVHAGPQGEGGRIFLVATLHVPYP